MGSGESSARKVSFGVDHEETVKVVRGVKLSGDLLQRMKGQTPEPSAQPPPSPQREAASPPPPPLLPEPRPQPEHCPEPKPHPQPEPRPQPEHCPEPEPRPQTPPLTTNPTPNTTADDKTRYDLQQAVVKEEMIRMAERERELVRAEMSKLLQRERLTAHQDNDKAQIMAQQLQRKEAELKALDAFYKEQLSQLEKRNLERYTQACEQFHEGATKAEAQIKSRSTDPVCSSLQSQILMCYRDNRDETLHCSDLAKQYLRCIQAAKKNLLVNHG